MGRVTLQTIADRVGVSRMTVSNAFSRPDQLSARLRDQILAVADELGYVGPDPTARALASGTAGAVGLLLSDIVPYALTDEIAMQFISGIADELGASGLALTLLSAASRDGVVQARDVAIDGALVYSCDPDSSAVGWLMRRRLPLVFVDQAPAPGIPSVNVDDRLGAQAAARYLVDLGHRAVAIVTTGYGGDFGIVCHQCDGAAFAVEVVCVFQTRESAGKAVEIGFELLLEPVEESIWPGVEQRLFDGVETRCAAPCVLQFHAERIVYDYGNVTAARDH